MPFAARVNDKTSHGGSLGPPTAAPLAARVATVLIEGLPAAVVGSLHVCVKGPDALLGPGNLVLPSPGLPRGVVISGVPVAAVRDKTTCGAQIVMGARTVLIGGLP